ncbi:DUF421 domain-containing protein [Alcanivorax quisquiliarum]|uniref:DUF421 domain-containing protein n=1 Tax=Alcanivorax quisquiliarum TaxID=2933565 RepID=A0ABT0E9I5_9GAMM|nr:YetF domain-containing protein [Alcanivorax quisquiliarum]MCK0538459.1 DUF421 domain-containing protein [Alcanivorax quisquiliarum]
MGQAYLLETSFWEIIARGSAVYFAVTILLRLIPKRQIGNIAPNDMIALVIVGSLAADAIMGEANSLMDLLLMVLVILAWDYLFNLAEFYFPRFRKKSEDSPTLLIHNGILLSRNLKKEKLTEEELIAHLRKQGISDPGQVKQAILEVDGEISVIKRVGGAGD